jgi:hypothetical protein
MPIGLLTVMQTRCITNALTSPTAFVAYASAIGAVFERIHINLHVR